MKTDFLILGGGIAGLSAANALADKGADCVLLESGSYPSHKICGEFISPEAIPLLEKWNVELKIRINQLKIITSKLEWEMKLTKTASSLSRYVLDEKLALRAEKKGCVVKTNAFIKNIEFPKKENGIFIVTLASGEQWTSKTLFISTGKLINSIVGEPFKPRYIGVKAHFKGINVDELKMHISKNAYFGVSPIGENLVNVAGIISANQNEILNCQSTFDNFLNSAEALPLKKTLNQSQALFDSWMITPVPEFGARKYPSWPNVFLLGDAAGVIAPATGNGLAMGLTSGILAVDYALKGEYHEYQKDWKKPYKMRIFKGSLLHQLFLSPKLVSAIPTITKLFPNLPSYCFKVTRGS